MTRVSSVLLVRCALDEAFVERAAPKPFGSGRSPVEGRTLENTARPERRRRRRVLSAVQTVSFRNQRHADVGRGDPGYFWFRLRGFRYARLEAFKCVLAIESLVRVAGYDGDVYFITENIASSCVPSQEELRARLGYDRAHVVYVDEGSPSPFEKSSDAERTNGTRSR